MNHIIATQQGYLPIEFDLDIVGESVNPINITFDGRPIELNQKQLNALLDYIDENLEKIKKKKNETLT